VLIGINPLLSPDLLYALRSMGHRQEVAIVDANFPCDPGSSRVIRLDGASSTETLAAVLSVLPLEQDDPVSAWRMIADGDPANMLPIFSEFEGIVARAARCRISPIDPGEFKDRTRTAYAVVITGERRLYGGIILRKGVVAPDTA